MKPDEAAEPQVRVVDRRWWARTDAPGADEAVAARKPTLVEDLERRLADATTQLQAVMTEHRRSLEEFEQVKARIRREVTRDVDRGKRAVLADLLDVLDNLDRAVGAARDTTPAPAVTDAAENLIRGVELVRDQFVAKLQALGVTRMNALGSPFDAARHEAVSLVPVADASQDGIVIAVAREGYVMGDELLRPASVVVGRHDRV